MRKRLPIVIFHRFLTLLSRCNCGWGRAGQFGLKSLFLCFLLAAVDFAYSLPFNQDMVDSQIRTGSMMRAPAPQSIPLGSLKYYPPASKEEAASAANPYKGDETSTARGRHLYAVHCYSCHGDFGRLPYQPGPVGLKTTLKVGEMVVPFQPPDLGADLYKDSPEGKSDGYLYGVIHWGGNVMMPALGWKLSDREHWDIVNYIRQVQGSR